MPSARPSASHSSNTNTNPTAPSRYYIYNPTLPLSDHEHTVQQAGYPFVSTTHLERGGRLNEHGHSSKNTHLIVEGTIVLVKSLNGRARFREGVAPPGAWVTMSRDVNYIGEAGEGGCVFVEGHQVLSPTTAERFRQRGTIVEVAGGTRGAFEVREDGH